MRKLDWWMAALAACLTALFFLWPPPARPDDLHLEVTVRELPQGHPGRNERYTDDRQQVEVLLRWRWLRAPRRPLFGEPTATVQVAVDRERWSRISEPSSWGPPNVEELLRRVGEPVTIDRFPVPYGKDGEFRYIFVARNNGERYRAPALDLRAHFVQQMRGDLVPPGHSWVRAVGGSYPLR